MMFEHPSTVVVAVVASAAVVAGAPAGSGWLLGVNYPDNDDSVTTTTTTTAYAYRTDPVTGYPILSGAECFDPYSTQAFPTFHSGSFNGTWTETGDDYMTGHEKRSTAELCGNSADQSECESLRPAYGDCCAELGFTAAPMILVFCQSALLVFFTVVPTLLGRCCCKRAPKSKKKAGAGEAQAGESEGDDGFRGSDQGSGIWALLGPNIYILVSGAGKLIGFYIIWNKALEVTKGLSGWERYQAFVYIVWASPVGVYCAVVVAKSMLDFLYTLGYHYFEKDKRKRQTKDRMEESKKVEQKKTEDWVDEMDDRVKKSEKVLGVSLVVAAIVFALCCIAIPSLLTHVIPGFLIYIPVVLAAALALSLLLGISYACKPNPFGWFTDGDGEDSPIKDLGQAVFMVLMYPFFITIFAFTFSYIPTCARSVYYGVGWSDAIVREYHARSFETWSSCSGYKLSESGSSAYLVIVALL